jgi:hypothetical protein
MNRLRLSEVPAYLYKLTGESRQLRTISFWVTQGRVKNGRTVKLKTEKVCGMYYTREEWVQEFIEEISR